MGMALRDNRVVLVAAQALDGAHNFRGAAPVG